MKVVFKYSIGLVRSLSVPKGSKVVLAGLQQGDFCVWMLVDTEEAEVEAREFVVLATGIEFSDDDNLVHVGSDKTADGSFVCHFFERLEMHTPQEWATRAGVRILDADGWRTVGSPPFDQPCTRVEYELRVGSCTVGPLATSTNRALTAARMQHYDLHSRTSPIEQCAVTECKQAVRTLIP